MAATAVIKKINQGERRWVLPAYAPAATTAVSPGRGMPRLSTATNRATMA
jgi:hypothetical protein